MNDEIKKMLSGCIGAVEANSFETMCLYERNKKYYGTWLENNSGLGVSVGDVNGKPVFLSIRTSIVNDHKILFYYPTSVMVDYDMIDTWLNENLVDGKHVDGCVNKTDAMNFHNIFSV